MKILKSLKAALGIEVKKRAGLFVSRPLMNGQEWADWATKWKIPGALSADDMHVTVLYSTVDVKMPQDDCPMTIATQDTWSPGCFCQMGPENQSLVFAFSAYSLSERHWGFIDNGANSPYPTYRPHLTITNAVGDFELPDEALAETPEFIVLGGEVYADLKTDADPSDQESDGADPDDSDDDDITLIVISVAASAAAKSTMANPEVLKSLNPLDQSALRDIAGMRTVTKGVAKRVMKSAWGQKILGSPNPEPSNRVAVAKVARTKEVTLRFTDQQRAAVKSEVVQKLNVIDEEKHLVYAVSNVYSIDGVLVEDLDGDSFTTEAMEEFIASVLKKTGTGKFEHKGDAVNEIVQGLVFGNDVQKALGIDLGCEFLLTCTHVPGDAEWAKVKEGNWEQSIAGRFTYYEDADA